MADARRETWITGIGIVSCLGEGPEAHWQRLNAAPPPPDKQAFAPYVVHRAGAARAGQADPEKGRSAPDGGVAADRHLCGRPCARQRRRQGQCRAARAHGHDRRRRRRRARRGRRRRDPSAVCATRATRATFLNERLMSDLRPTLFLAQLSNLMAGNISIVHGVTGSSRTFMGEEVGRRRRGTDRVVAHPVRAERHRPGRRCLQCRTQGHAAAVRRPAATRMKGPLCAGVGARSARRRLALGTLGAFLVLESRDSATARNAKPLARLTSVQSDRARRQPGAVCRLAGADVDGDRAQDRARPSGHHVRRDRAPSRRRRKSAHGFRTVPALPVRATGTYLGHGVEPQFVMNIALASHSRWDTKGCPPPPRRSRRPWTRRYRQVVVTGVGHWRGEGMALVEAAG